MFSTSVADRLRLLGTAALSNAMRARDLRRVVVGCLRPVAQEASRFAGPAYTLRYLPAREDLPELPRGPLHREVLERAPAGSVLVVDALGFTGAAVFGDLMGTRVSHRGLSGVVVDGAVRDRDQLADLGLPVWARATCPWPSNADLVPWETDVPVQVGGVHVRPGDWVVADADAVLVLPAELAGEVLAAAEDAEAVDEAARARLAAGGLTEYPG